MIDHFRAFMEEEKSKARYLSHLSPETFDRYKVYRKNAWVNPNGGAVNSEDEVEEYTRKGARSHTINFELAALRTILNLVVKWGYLTENPTKGVKKLKVRDAKAVRFLTTEECARLLDACPPDLYSIYFTFLHTGMRKAELENLEWDDVDFERRCIKIRRKESWQPKTGEREIPIGDRLLPVLKELQDANMKGSQSNYVFPGKSGGKLKIKLREKLIRIAEQAGIEDLTKVHTLRHTFASHLVMNGVDLPTVQKLMGHSDIETTMIYAHLAPDHLSAAVNKLPFG